MNEENVKKRGWVKNAAIVFLAVMLVLTFFSNTIMNRSLPEVAAQYTTSGTITARVRGTGTVRANENFEVKTGQTRRVSEVLVKVGDEVERGDILIRFEGSESPELAEAQTALRKAERELEEELIKTAHGDGKVADAVRAVQRARNHLSEAQRKLAGIHFSDESLAHAQAMFSHAQAMETQARAARNSAESYARARQLEFDIADAELRSLTPPPDGEIDPVYEAAVKKRNNAELALLHANASLNTAIAALDEAIVSALALETELKIQQGHRDEWFTANTAVRDAQLEVDDANSALTLAQTGDDVTSSLDSIKLRELRRDIEEARDKIEELEKEGTTSEISSPVSGVVIERNVTVNETTEKDTVLMVIEVVDRGYSVNINVTAEQASRVNVGDMADVDRGWWSGGEEIRATLINIRNDPEDPVMKRILHFNITGDIKSGDQLNLTLAQRSENYNIIVPNSAIRSDTNGDFVLVVMSRTSPLGNRYIATRVDVTIMASDDTNTAISGALTGWDFVVTTSTAPIDPGMQVRLVDNP